MLLQHFGCCRWVCNWAIHRKTIAWQESRKRISRYDLDQQLPLLKKSAETEWLKEVNSQALQQSLVHLELAFDKFFKEKKGYPRFKSKQGPQSFSCPQGTELHAESSTFYLPKIGCVKLALSRLFEGKIKTVTVSRVPNGQVLFECAGGGRHGTAFHEEVQREHDCRHRRGAEAFRHALDRRKD